MKQFMLLHVGFEMPTDEVMAQWNNWLQETASITTDMGGFMNGTALTADGAQDLPMDKSVMTGYSIIEAEDKEAAIAIAEKNPFITAIHVYELRKH